MVLFFISLTLIFKIYIFISDVCKRVLNAESPYDFHKNPINRANLGMKKFKIIGLFILLSSFTYSQPIHPNSSKPNIVMICVDDLNDYIGAMGHPDAITPNLDRLIKRGTLFTNAQTQSPLCGPSRVSIMTGLRPSTTGIYGLIADNNVKPSSETTQKNIFLHQYFKDHGYYTMGRGKIFHHNIPDGLMDEQEKVPNQLGPVPSKKMNYFLGGTDTDWGAYPEVDSLMPDYKTAEWAVEKLSKKYNKPFFLTVGLFRPHVPWHVPQKWYDLYDPEKLSLPAYLKTDFDDLPDMALKVEATFMPSTEWAIKNNQWRNILQAYLACVSFADDCVGKVLDALEKSPYADNTIVVLWSDHGYRLGEKNRFAKQCLWDRATKAPLIYAGKGIQRGIKIDVPVELFSTYPTLLDLTGLPANKHIEAKSIAPLLAKPQNNWEQPAITTWGRGNHGVRLSNYHYIRYVDGSEEFYDLKSDPNEFTNLANHENYAKLKNKLKSFVPERNAVWVAESKMDAIELFKQQRLNDIPPK